MTAFASVADEFGRKTRIKLYRLAVEAAVPSSAGRQQLYERYYSGDRCAWQVRSTASTTGTHNDRIFGMLDDLDARSKLGLA